MMSRVTLAATPVVGTDPHWMIDRVDGQYQWHVRVGDDTADGLTRTEPDALREVAWALDWLQGGVSLAPGGAPPPAPGRFLSPSS